MTNSTGSVEAPAEWADRTAQEQGLPRHVEDQSVLAGIVSLILPDDKRPAKKEQWEPRTTTETSSGRSVSEALEELHERSEQYVYFIVNPDTGLIKIGTSKHPESRLKTLQAGAGTELELLGVITGGQVREHGLHEQFGDLRVSGEWFRPERPLLDYIDKALS